MEVTLQYLAEWSTHTTSSPLYSHFAGVIAGDEALLRVINRIEHRPPPNVLLAGVHYLLMRNPDHPLAGFYPSLSERPRPVEEVDEVFTGFVLEHEEELVALGRERHTQTNEARRCTALLPAIWAGEHQSFHLVDIGTSAGLNLALDRYHYRRDEIEWGPESPVRLHAALRGAEPAPRTIEVLSRTGLDLHPVDTGDPEDRAWLEALVWPEASERRRRLRNAVEIAAGLTIELVAGNALETLPRVLDGLPAGEPAVVMNSFAFNQLSPEQRTGVEEIVHGGRARRPVQRVWLEFSGLGGEGAELRTDPGARWVTLGRAHHHGEWLELYARP
ncbi:MAG: DUF2332 domain-containing protein [Actinobacteria bacterium]|nr:DUF2332 domain-containing protein [Actinomycetota bacterium]